MHGGDGGEQSGRTIKVKILGTHKSGKIVIQIKTVCKTLDASFQFLTLLLSATVTFWSVLKTY